MFAEAFRNKTVWLSGHTGFKGAWLAQWLLELGADVHGFALEPATQPALFDQLGLAKRLHHQIADIRDPAAVRESIGKVQPDFVFHLAAQPLVRLSYEQPLETYATNVMGTAHVLEALRALGKPCAAVLITTDKCYENREQLHSYCEEDPLGGYDPYSSSKAAAEIAISAWRRSFFKKHPVKIASARAGNVIGGGDWAKDRIVPDCIRALQKKQPIAVRNPNATRPWQHVLEPLSGYLWLAACLSQPLAAPKQSKGGSTNDSQLASAFNFGPTHEANRTVGELVTEVLKHWPGRWEDKSDPHAVHEAGLLQLSTDKAHALLGWQPLWSFSVMVERTVAWYRETAADPRSAPVLATRQIGQYQADALRAGLSWAVK
ncbi:MAG: CDP-glucose 4,6-dehydratase [Verrucomicrobiota bacterium]|jgi:CDP-glucose 4,6-dehydratase